MRYKFIPVLFVGISQLFAQSDLLPTPRFPNSSYFRERFTAPNPPKVELQPPTKLSDFVVDGKLELSLRGYLDLVLANNTDIQISRLSIETTKNAITRSYGRFDPSVAVGFRATRTNSPASDALAGAAVQSTLSQPFTFAYQQTLDTGTQYTVGFDGTKSTTNSSFATFNPSINSRLNFSFSQPLLQNRGRSVNKLNIAVARSRYRQSEHALGDQLTRILQQAELAYWSVIEARESLKVQEDGLALQDQLLKRSNRELELGAISPLEIFRPQQSYASQEVVVTQARYRLQQVEDQLRRQMGADLDPQFRNTPIVLTETVQPPTDATPLDKEKYVDTALQKRPDLKAQIQSLDIDDLSYRQAKNRLKPDLSLTGGYTSSGRGGNFLQRTDVFSGDGARSTINQIIPGGFGDSLSQVFNFNYPIYSMGLNLRFPIRDRAASADLADAVVNKRLDTLRVRGLEQNVRQDVLNAVTQVESARAGVRLAQVALDFSQKNVDAEQKRYDLGVTTIFFLLDAQQQLTRAKADLVTQSVQLNRAHLNLLRVTGTLLEERNVQVQ